MRPYALALLLATSAFALPHQEPEFPVYVERSMRGFTVQVDAELAAEDSELGREVLELLDFKLYETRRVLPEAAMKELEKVVIWMDVDDPNVPGGVYHPSRKWLEANKRNPEMAGCVQFGNARNFLAWSFDQPSMLIHELAHAYHHQVIGYGEEGIVGAFRKAHESGSYDSVLRNSGRTEKAYAMNNAKEYFAELSEAWFGVNDFYPFVKAELRVHDEEGFDVVRRAWYGE